MRFIPVFFLMISLLPAMDAEAQGYPYYRWLWPFNLYAHQGMGYGYPAVPYRMGVLGGYPPANFSVPPGRGPTQLLTTRPLHLCQIITLVERKGYDPIVELEFEDDVWEIEAYRYGQLYELTVSPFSGKIISAELDDNEEEEEDSSQ